MDWSSSRRCGNADDSLVIIKGEECGRLKHDARCSSSVEDDCDGSRSGLVLDKCNDTLCCDWSSRKHLRKRCSDCEVRVRELTQERRGCLDYCHKLVSLEDIHSAELSLLSEQLVEFLLKDLVSLCFDCSGFLYHRLRYIPVSGGSP